MENNNALDFKPHPPFPILDIDGIMATGKQFDLDITIPTDNRNVVYGVVKNCFKEPIKDAVVKLIEIECGKDGIKRRLPVSHTFTDEYGEFVFGPLCPDKDYAIDIWVNKVHHYDIDVKCHHEGTCLKNISTKKSEFSNNK